MDLPETKSKVRPKKNSPVPVSWENGDPPKWGPGVPIFPGIWGPGSPLSWENGDPGSPFSREYGDPLSENGDPLYDRRLTVGKWGSIIIRLEFRPMQGLVNH